MRASRFRWLAGILSPTPREGSEALKTYLLGLVNPVDNSTRSFGRDLSRAEIEASKAANTNQFPQRRRWAIREAEALGWVVVGKREKRGKNGEFCKRTIWDITLTPFPKQAKTKHHHRPSALPPHSRRQISRTSILPIIHKSLHPQRTVLTIQKRTVILATTVIAHTPSCQQRSKPRHSIVVKKSHDPNERTMITMAFHV